MPTVGITCRLIRSDGTVIIPEQGGEQLNVSDFYLDRPGVGTHTYKLQINTATSEDSLRRALMALVVRK